MVEYRSPVHVHEYTYVYEYATNANMDVVICGPNGQFDMHTHTHTHTNRTKRIVPFQKNRIYSQNSMEIIVFFQLQITSNFCSMFLNVKRGHLRGLLYGGTTRTCDGVEEYLVNGCTLSIATEFVMRLIGSSDYVNGVFFHTLEIARVRHLFRFYFPVFLLDNRFHGTFKCSEILTV